MLKYDNLSDIDRRQSQMKQNQILLDEIKIDYLKRYHTRLTLADSAESKFKRGVYSQQKLLLNGLVKSSRPCNIW